MSRCTSCKNRNHILDICNIHCAEIDDEKYIHCNAYIEVDV